MSKKIYDIKPPKMAQKVGSVNKVEIKKRRTATHKMAPVLYQPKLGNKRFPLREMVIGGGIILLLFGVYFYNTLQKVDIQISPKIDTLSIQEKIIADKTASVINANKKIIPALYVEELKEMTQNFPASGSASNDGKATGTIKIYNKISPSSPLSLKVGTHFLSNSGKYFVTLDKVVIPAMSGKTAGSISARVQAKESGSAYNIGASKFSVPKLSGTAYYYNIWAESTTAMSGGYTGDVKKVTNADIANAKDVLTKKLLIDAETALKAKISEEYVLLDSAILRNVISATADVKADAIADNFNETAKVKVSALMFKKADVQEFVKSDLLKQLPDGKNYVEKSLDIQYSADSVDLQKGVIALSIKISSGTYFNIQKNDIVELASQNSADEIKKAISQRYGDKVSDVKISFWPFWANKAPSNKNRISVELRF